MHLPIEVEIVYRAGLLLPLHEVATVRLNGWTMPALTDKAKASCLEELAIKPLPCFCLTCLRQLGTIEGGLVKSCCSHCRNDENQWPRITFISNNVGSWASDKFSCLTYQLTPSYLIDRAMKARGILKNG